MSCPKLLSLFLLIILKPKLIKFGSGVKALINGLAVNVDVEDYFLKYI